MCYCSAAFFVCLLCIYYDIYVLLSYLISETCKNRAVLYFDVVLSYLKALVIVFIFILLVSMHVQMHVSANIQIYVRINMQFLLKNLGKQACLRARFPWHLLRVYLEKRKIRPTCKGTSKVCSACKAKTTRYI